MGKEKRLPKAESSKMAKKRKHKKQKKQSCKNYYKLIISRYSRNNLLTYYSECRIYLCSNCCSNYRSKVKGRVKLKKAAHHHPALVVQALLVAITKGDEQVVGPVKVEVLAVRALAVQALAVVILMIVGLRKH